MKKKIILFGIVTLTAVAVACGEKAATPVSPSPAVSSDTAAAGADGSTLKATAPAPQQPANGSTSALLTPNLVIANSTLKYLGDVALVGTLQYRFSVETTGGASVHNVLTGAGAGLTGSKVPAGALQPDTTYRWRARAEIGSSAGPWSAYWTFTTAKSGGGLPSYQTATELWDNLTDGKTIGTLVGGAQLMPGKGVYLPAFESHVTYTLQSTLTSGAIECLIENLSSDTNGGKTKVFSSQQGYSDITDNPYRFTIEKRGDDHPDSGKYRLRIITGNATSGFYDSDRIQPSSLVGVEGVLPPGVVGKQRRELRRPRRVGDGAPGGELRVQLPGHLPPEPARGAHRRAGAQGRPPRRDACRASSCAISTCRRAGRIRASPSHRCWG